MSDVSNSQGPDRLARQPWYGNERGWGRTGALDRAWSTVDSIARARWTQIRGRASAAIVPAVHAAMTQVEHLDDRGLMQAARQAGNKARRTDLNHASDAAQLFAIVREAAGRQLGLWHYDEQIMGGFAMLRGQLAEMQTGEGKTLTATLTAATMALTGRPVHVVTVNDYLATRDAEEMGPVYRALGLSVGLVVQGMTLAQRRDAYAAHVTYCTNKELAFDHLRDRLNKVGGPGPAIRRTRFAHGNFDASDAGLLRGLVFALVDEADSVLIDEARTPLILSGTGPENYNEAMLRAAATAADELGPGDFSVDTEERRVELNSTGIDRLDLACAKGPLSNRIVREELVVKALTARALFMKDQHYLVRDGKIEIIDEYTGRVMPDRFWSDGLHQLIELKEGVQLSSGRLTLARTSYQRFFRRYDRIAGMSGTAREVAGELWRTYGLRVATIPTHRPVQRTMLPAEIFHSAQAKWDAIAEETKRLNRTGIPVLIGTRTVAESHRASEALTAAEIEHVVLSASQDAREAETIAQTGQIGQVTVATNIAGRGADIKLGKGVVELGGLHVIMSECHDSRRIDRQLAGRAGRQGDPGVFRPMLSFEDQLVRDDRSIEFQVGRKLTMVFGEWYSRLLMTRIQWRAEARHARMRRDLLRQDEVMNDALAFSGEPE